MCVHDRHSRLTHLCCIAVNIVMIPNYLDCLHIRFSLAAKVKVWCERNVVRLCILARKLLSVSETSQIVRCLMSCSCCRRRCVLRTSTYIVHPYSAELTACQSLAVSSALDT